MSDSGTIEVAVIGTGFAGLSIAESLHAAGVDYLALDKGRSPGGRAATRRIERARVDHGIPWLTRTGGLSDALIDRLREAGMLERLYVGGSVGDGWVSTEGITAATKFMASDLDVRFSNRVESVEPGAAGEPNRLWITDAEGRGYELLARHVVITAPVPQAIEMAPILADRIGSVEPESIYEKAVIGLARLRHSSNLPEEVIFENPADGIESVIIESAKFPDRPPSVSIRSDPETSERMFDLPDEDAWSLIAGAVKDLAFLAEEPAEHQVKRWRYSKPARPVDAPFLLLGTDRSSIAACGDGFDTGAETGLEAALASAGALIEAAPWGPVQPSTRSGPE
jgi:predicted NAD/FAD-dependent oxidoreductase